MGVAYTQVTCDTWFPITCQNPHPFTEAWSCDSTPGSDGIPVCLPGPQRDKAFSFSKGGTFRNHFFKHWALASLLFEPTQTFKDRVVHFPLSSKRPASASPLTPALPLSAHPDMRSVSHTQSWAPSSGASCAHGGQEVCGWGAAAQGPAHAVPKDPVFD